MKRFVIMVLMLISILLLTLNLGSNEEEVKEEKVVEKNISLPSTIQAYTYEGEKTDKTYEWLLSNKIVNKITCKNGTIAKFNYEDNSVSLSNIKLPDYCTIDFKEGYMVTLNAGSTGTVSPESQTTGYNGSVSFTVTPSDGYKAKLSTNTCGGTLSGNTYTINNVKENKSCSIEFKKNGTVLSTLIKSYSSNNTNGVYNENGYRYEGSNPSNYIYMTNKNTNEKELWRIIGVFNDGENGEEVIRVRKVEYEDKAYDTKSTNHWSNSTLYATWKNTYSTTNYKNTVNFKMYLGTESSYKTLTSAGWYEKERGSTPGKTAADSYGNAVSFIGSVGLMYPSDYGYGVLASDCNREVKLYSYDETAACHNNNWLFQGGGKVGSNAQWLISPSATAPSVAFYVRIGGYVGNVDGYASSQKRSYPVMALSSDVIVDGSGNIDNPYIIVN